MFAGGHAVDNYFKLKKVAVQFSEQGVNNKIRFEQEALERTSICMEMVDRYILFHPFIEAHPSLKEKAAAAHQLLFDLYQEIGGMPESTM